MVLDQVPVADSQAAWDAPLPAVHQGLRKLAEEIERHVVEGPEPFVVLEIVDISEAQRMAGRESLQHEL